MHTVGMRMMIWQFFWREEKRQLQRFAASAVDLRT